MSHLSFDHYPLSPAELPPSWTVAAMEQISASIQPGFPSGNHNSTGEGVPHLRPMNLDRLGQLDFAEVKHVPCNADDGAIIKEIYGWDASKKKFTRTAILKRLEWMRRKNYVPTGGGHRTMPMKKSAARREPRGK